MSYHNNNHYTKGKKQTGTGVPIPYVQVKVPTKQKKLKPTNQTYHKRNSTQSVKTGILDRKEPIFSKRGVRNARLSNKGREDIIVKGKIFQGTQHQQSKKKKDEIVLQQRLKALNQNNGLKDHNEKRNKPVGATRGEGVKKNSGMKMNLNRK